MQPYQQQLKEKYDFNAWLASREIALPPVCIETLWLNITRQCNQTCRHCHIVGSPENQLHMGDNVMAACIEVIKANSQIQSVDITGGAPELHPRFEHLVKSIRAAGKRVIVRHNLTITIDGDPLSGATKDYLPAFFAANQVELIASLPNWRAETTDRVRGPGVFEKSIESLKRLMKVGYNTGRNLKLKLVSNCDGPLLPADRVILEREFNANLAGFGITLDELLTVTNMPVGRYAETLQQEGRYNVYMDNLVATFNEVSARAAVCRRLINVGIDGRLFDCDFNNALGLAIGGSQPLTIADFDPSFLLERDIVFGAHCFGCTAGAGSG